MIEAGTERDVYSYEPFTRHAFYRDVNAALVELAIGRIPMPPDGRRRIIVDLGCGTGALIQLLCAALVERGIDATVIGVEPSAAALEVAKRRLAGSALDVRFVRGDAGSLADLAPLDAVFFCNAIHLLSDKDTAVGQIVGALAPTGVLAVNSAFFTGAYAPGTERFYRLWTARAMRRLRRDHPQVRLSGAKAPAMTWLSPEEYRQLARRHGLEVSHCDLDEVQMTLGSFQDIGHYWLFIEGALPGAPLAAGAEALYHGAVEAFEELALTSVPRRWLQLVATAPAAAPRAAP